MTTVGYGDFAPKTWAGRLIGSACAVFGLLIVALPISVIGGNFSLYYAHVKARLKLPRKNRTLQQDNMLGLLRHPLGLSLRHRDRKTLKRTKHHAIRLKTDVVVSPSSAIKIMQRQECFDEILNDKRSTDEDEMKTNGSPDVIPMRTRAVVSGNVLPRSSKSDSKSIEGAPCEDLNDKSRIYDDFYQTPQTTKLIDNSITDNFHDSINEEYALTIDHEGKEKLQPQR